MSDLPPLPPGYRLREEPALDPSIPPALPPGYTLREPEPPPAPEKPMSWGDWGRAAMTVGVRGAGGLVSGLTDPMAPLRQLISPELARMERTELTNASVPTPSEAATRAGTAVFDATGVPEYHPTTGFGRLGMGVAEGAVGGGLLGLGGTLLRGAPAAASAGANALQRLYATLRGTQPIGVPTAASAALGGTSAGTGQLAYETAKPPELTPEQEQSLTPEQRATRQSQQDWAERYSVGGSLVPGGAIAAAGLKARPRMTPDMEAAGVNPTIGQALGGWINRAEQGLASYPWLGDFMKGGRAGAVEEFNTGAINTKVLAPLNEKLNPATPSGRDAIGEAADRVGARYDAITPHLSVTPDQQFGTGLTDIFRRSTMLSRDHQQQLANTFRTEVLDRLPSGNMTGQSFRNAESTLGQVARNYRSSAVASERQYGNLILDLQTELRNLLKRTNPDHAAELENIHTAYAALTRIEKAATKPNAGIGGVLEYGNYTPTALQTASKEMDPTLRHRSFARGDALLQDYAEQGRKLLGDTVPDSGTAYRSLLTLGAGATAGGLLSLPTAAMIGAAGLGLRGLYSPSGRAAVNYLLQRPGQMLPRGVLAAPEQNY